MSSKVLSTSLVKTLTFVALIAPLIAGLGGCGQNAGDGSTPTPKQETAQLDTADAIGATQKQVGIIIGAGTAPLSVESLTMISEERVSRTVFEYPYKITVLSGGLAITSVTIDLSETGAGTTVVDGQVQIAAMAANQTLLAPDTIRIRHDRSLPFDPSAFRWLVRATLPEPPTGGVAGFDSDRDGIRDDVQQYIDAEFTNNAPKRAAAQQLARSLQVALLVTDNAQAAAAESALISAALCLHDRFGPQEASRIAGAIQVRQWNTRDRMVAEGVFRDRRTGSLVLLPDVPDKSTCN